MTITPVQYTMGSYDLSVFEVDTDDDMDIQSVSSSNSDDDYNLCQCDASDDVASAFLPSMLLEEEGEK